MISGRFLIFYGVIFAAGAVLLGAFGAHMLENSLDANEFKRYETGVEYQFYHAFAVILSGILYCFSDKERASDRLVGSLQTGAGFCFIAGIFLFCGSLYLYALSSLSFFGMIVPIGGVLFVCGWCLLAASMIKWTQN